MICPDCNERPVVDRFGRGYCAVCRKNRRRQTCRRYWIKHLDRLRPKAREKSLLNGAKKLGRETYRDAWGKLHWVPLPAICHWCGSIFSALRTRKRKMYCSRKCANKARSVRQAAREKRARALNPRACKRCGQAPVHRPKALYCLSCRQENEHRLNALYHATYRAGLTTLQKEIEKEKSRERNARYRQKHKERLRIKFRERARRYRAVNAANRKKLAITCRKWRVKNPEKVRTYIERTREQYNEWQKNYRAKNRESYNAKQRDYRKRVMSNPRGERQWLRRNRIELAQLRKALRPKASPSPTVESTPEHSSPL